MVREAVTSLATNPMVDEAAIRARQKLTGHADVGVRMLVKVALKSAGSTVR